MITEEAVCPRLFNRPLRREVLIVEPGATKLQPPLGRVNLGTDVFPQPIGHLLEEVVPYARAKGIHEIERILAQLWGDLAPVRGIPVVEDDPVATDRVSELAWLASQSGPKEVLQAGESCQAGRFTGRHG